MSTLRVLINEGYRIAVHHERLNPPCTHSDWLDLEALAAKLGDDYDLSNPDFLARLRCTRCGGKGHMATRTHPRTAPRS